MTREKMKKAAIAVAVVVAGAAAVKLLPMMCTLSAVVGFVGCGACTYLWQKRIGGDE